MSSNTFQVTTDHCIDFPIAEGHTFFWADGAKDKKILFLFTAKEPISLNEIYLRPMANQLESVPMEHTLRIQIPSIFAARMFKQALEELVQKMELEDKING